MLAGPIYGDPTCPEEEFPDLAIRIAQRGLRGARTSIARGITNSNRRLRSERRAYIGY